MNNQQDCRSIHPPFSLWVKRPLFVGSGDFITATIDLPRFKILSFLPHHAPRADCLFSRFINNEFVKGQDGKTFETINPSTEKPIVAVHEATEKDVDIAVSSARKTFETSWRHVTPEQRGRYLVKLADLVERDLETIAAIESLDNGKAFSMAKVDIGMVAGCLRYYGGWADKISGKVIETTPDVFSYTRQEPVSIESKAGISLSLLTIV